MKKIQKWYDEGLSKEIHSRSRNKPSDTTTNFNFSDQIMMTLNDEDDPEEDDVILKEIPQWTRKEILITAAAAAASICALLSLLTAYTSGFILLIGHGEALLCSIAGALGMTIPIYSAYQEQKITDFRGKGQWCGGSKRSFSWLILVRCDIDVHHFCPTFYGI